MDANNAVFEGTALAACLSLQLDCALLCRGSYLLFCFQQCMLLCSDSRNHASTSTVHELMLAQSIKTTLAAHLPWISAAVQPLVSQPVLPANNYVVRTSGRKGKSCVVSQCCQQTLI